MTPEVYRCLVFPASAGIQGFEGDPLPPIPYQGQAWTPAFAGVTSAALAFSMPLFVGI
jgi:hypothetical protein